MSSKNTIALAGEAEVPFENVYFPFPDGGLDYDCVTCGSQCCKGHGYTLQPGSETLYQLETRPFVRYFLKRDPKAPEKAPVVRNSPPACFFLTEGGLCDIQLTSGFPAKPETCRLFPFNSIRKVEEYLVVGPHGSLCPLRVTQRGESSARSRHNELLAQMQSQGIKSRIVDCKGIVDDLAGLLALERSFVSLLEAPDHQGNVVDLVEFQQAATRAFVDQTSRKRFAPHMADPRWMANAMCEILDVDIKQILTPDVELDRVFGCLTPYIRSRLVFRPVDPPMREGLEPDLDHAPFTVLALYIITRLARLAGMRLINLQTINRLWSEFSSLVAILPYLADVVVWRPEVKVELTLPRGYARFQRNYLRAARDLIPERQHAAQKPLFDILCEASSNSGTQRMDWLHLLADLFTNVELYRPHTKSKTVPKFRTRLQKWTLQNLPDDVLNAIADRVAAKSPSPFPAG